MMKKKIDARIRLLIENAAREKHRSFFFMVGDHGRDQVVNLHYMLSKTSVKSRPSVLWCYKKELGFSSHRKKRMRQIKTMVKRGLMDPDKDDPFELFISSTDIRFCYYKETQSILGNTFGMCVLQDFEAITPNILARTIETVEGGGIVIILLRNMSSLRQLHDMTMDVHARYRTEAHKDVVARFNERFLLSLADCNNCLVVDDELNVLPISMHTRDMQRSIEQQQHESSVGNNNSVTSEVVSPNQRQLNDLSLSLKDTPTVGPLANLCRTLDQARALLTFVEAISDAALRSTIALTAARGRGKSAALGLAISAAVAYGYANIFVTSPSPENLGTLFEFIFKGFDSLGYEEHLDYDIVQSTNPDFNKAIVRVNIHREHRQTIQYIMPQDAHVLGQAELLIIDEAAAIPLPLVKKLLGPYLIFMASTINGYEGTGRSLSLKLLSQLRQEQADNNDAKTNQVLSRTLKEIKLEESIRYAPNDPIEKWLCKVLCLDTAEVPRLPIGCPHPSKCDLYYVERDTLFSYHQASESFLQKIMSLCVASHYKNSPNDLQLMSDAPAHHLFVLLAPVDVRSASLPEVLCVIQVCLEGKISRQSAMSSFARGQRPSGDLIPWTVSQQFQDNDFALLSGARIVRIATHPDYQRMGYGKRALSLLIEYFEGCHISLSEKSDLGETNRGMNVHSVTLNGDLDDNTPTRPPRASETSSSLLNETIKPRKNIQPLLRRLDERPAEKLDYIGVSYGLTKELFRFWKKGLFLPVYLRLTENELTAEHTCIMLRTLNSADENQTKNDWLLSFHQDFSKRFLHLLGYNFRKFAPELALDVIALPSIYDEQQQLSSAPASMQKAELHGQLSPYDLKRLDSYANNLVDYHLIMDLVPVLSEHYFLGRLGKNLLSPVQAAILIAIGRQYRTVEGLEADIQLPSSQILALFNKIIRKLAAAYKQVGMQDFQDAIHDLNDDSNVEHPAKAVQNHNTSKREAATANRWDPHEKSVDDELNHAGSNEMKKMTKSLLDKENLNKYAISGSDDHWANALANVSTMGENGNGGRLSIPSDPSTKRKPAHPEVKRSKKTKTSKRK